MLKLFVESFDEIDPSERYLYVLDSETGQWKVNVDIESYVRGLKSALRKEREAVRDLQKKLRRLTDGVEALRPFGGMPEGHQTEGRDAG